MIVYVDVLLFVNFIVNYFLLLASCRTASVEYNRYRIIFSALIGAFASLIIFLPYMGFILNILYKTFLAALMVKIGFTYINLREYFKQLFMFFTVTFLFGGAMLAVSIWISPNNMIYYNGVVYFDISAILLIITTVVSYIAILIFSRIFKPNNLSDDIYTVIIEGDKNLVTLNGLMDTGNHLKEPFSDTPVIIVNYDNVKSIMPLHIENYIINKDTDTSLSGNNIRMIPYTVVENNGLLPAFKPYKLYLICKDTKYIVNDVYVAVTKEKIGNHKYDVLLNPDIMKIKI